MSDDATLSFHPCDVRYQSKTDITTAPTLFFFTAARIPMAPALIDLRGIFATMQCQQANKNSCSTPDKLKRSHRYLINLREMLYSD